MAKKKAHELNKEIEVFMDTKVGGSDFYTRDEIEFVKQYSGSGGLVSAGATGRGILHEYYTDQQIAKDMWDIASAYGFIGGNVLEPSAGVGRLIKDAPDYLKVWGFEINKYAARIAELAHLGATVYPRHFETAFMAEPRYRTRIKGDKLTSLEGYPFSLIISNPPFGVHKNFFSGFFKRPKFKWIEHFFMYYGMKLLKPGGLLVYLTNSNFMRNGNTHDQAKKDLEGITEFVDAVRIGSVFNTTDAPVDILVWRRI